MSAENGTPAEKLAALNERLKGTALLSLLNIKSKPAPDALMQRVTELRDVVFGLCAHLAADDPVRATAIERLRSVELLLHDPIEWHILARAQELRQDPTDPQMRATLEAAFYEEHVPRTVWQSVAADGTQSDLRKSLRLPLLLDVELDVAGKPTRCQMQNLSRDGVCLEVPAGFAGTHVAFTVQMPATGTQIALAGDVVWRDTGRVGVAFKLGMPEQNALDASLQAHFASLQRTVDRWREVAPRSGSAVACAAIVGYASSALPSSRREHLDRLAAAAQADFGSKDLQLALAKLRIEERDYKGAAQALKRVVVNDRVDPRYRLLELTLAQRQGTGGVASLQRLVAAGRVPLAILAFTGVIAASVVIVLSLQGPYEELRVPVGGLPCQRMGLLDSHATCFLNAADYQARAAKERATLARKTLDDLKVRGVTTMSVHAADESVLDFFDERTITLTLATP